MLFIDIFFHYLGRLHTFGKSERLKSRKQIGLLFSHGKKLSCPPFLVYYLVENRVENDSSVLQMGAGVSTKNFRKAVLRNRIKRLIREAYRLQNGDLKIALSQAQLNLKLFIIYTDKTLPDYLVLKDKMLVVLQKIKALVGTKDERI